MDGWARPPAPPSAWPVVTVGDPARYRTIEQGIDEDLVLAMPRTVIAAGTVDEIPWVIQAYVTAPGPNARWWHHGPVGPELEFLLGEDRSLGGGSGAARIQDGTDFTCDVGFFGALPRDRLVGGGRLGAGQTISRCE